MAIASKAWLTEDAQVRSGIRMAWDCSGLFLLKHRDFFFLVGSVLVEVNSEI